MTKSGTIPRELDDRVKRELDRGERVLWMEQPVPRYFTASSTGMMLFGVPWTAFSVFWIFAASGSKFPDFSEGFSLWSLFPLFGLPFVLIGLTMLSAPLWSYRKAFKTVYVITDRRAITFDSGLSMTIRSYQPDQLSSLQRMERPDGSGDVIFGQGVWLGPQGRQHSVGLGGFLNIREPKAAEDMLRRLAEQEEHDGSTKVHVLR